MSKASYGIVALLIVLLTIIIVIATTNNKQSTTVTAPVADLQNDLDLAIPDFSTVSLSLEGITIGDTVGTVSDNITFYSCMYGFPSDYPSGLVTSVYWSYSFNEQSYDSGNSAMGSIITYSADLVARHIVNDKIVFLEYYNSDKYTRIRIFSRVDGKYFVEFSGEIAGTQVDVVFCDVVIN